MVKRLLCAFADHALTRKFEKQSYLVYITFMEQCTQVLDLLKRAQLLFPEDDRQFDYGHPSINMAKTIHRQTLLLTGKALGKEHLHTLTSMNTLASLHDSQGKYDEAEPMCRQTLLLR